MSTRLTLLCLLLVAPTIWTAGAPSPAGTQPSSNDQSAQDLFSRYVTDGRSLDATYYKYGIRIDLARYDLKEMGRQGKPVPDGIMNRMDAADHQLRAEWLNLDRKREHLHTVVLSFPPEGDAVLRIDDREDAGVKLNVSLPGAWRAFYPAGDRDEQEGNGPGTVSVCPFRGHEMVVIQLGTR